MTIDLKIQNVFLLVFFRCHIILISLLNFLKIDCKISYIIFYMRRGSVVYQFYANNTTQYLVVPSRLYLVKNPGDVLLLQVMVHRNCRIVCYFLANTKFTTDSRDEQLANSVCSIYASYNGDVIYVYIYIDCVCVVVVYRKVGFNLDRKHSCIHVYINLSHS